MTPVIPLTYVHLYPAPINIFCLRIFYFETGRLLVTRGYSTLSRFLFGNITSELGFLILFITFQYIDMRFAEMASVLRTKHDSDNTETEFLMRPFHTLRSLISSIEITPVLCIDIHQLRVMPG